MMSVLHRKENTGLIETTRSRISQIFLRILPLVLTG